MQYVPQPTLGAIVIAAALSLADIPATRRLWHQRRTEFALSIVAFLGRGPARGAARHPARDRAVDPQRVPPGVVAAPGRARPGRGPRRACTTPTRYPDAELLPGLVVYRFDAPLIFANSRTFGDAVRAMAEERPDLRWVLVAAEPMTDVDTTAADMLAELDAWLNDRGVSLVFAELKDPVRDKIERYELDRTIDPAHFFPTLDEAVAAYVAETGETWQAQPPPTREEQS